MGGETNPRSCNICTKRGRACDGEKPICSTCICNGDANLCDQGEGIPLPWDRSWEPSIPLPYSGSPLDQRSNTEPTLVPQRHAALITGLTSLYDTLISLRYLKPADVQRPPHTSPKPAVAATRLRSWGFEPEAVELMTHLPYLRRSAYDEVGTENRFELAPGSEPQSYLEDADEEHLRHARDPHFLYKNDIPPCALRITVARYGGTSYIYDTRDGTIATWSAQSDPSAVYPTLPRQPAAQVLATLLSNFVTLTWIPWLTRFGPTIFTPPPEDLLDYLREMSSNINIIRSQAIARTEANGYYGRRRLYRGHGWPDNFSGEEFARAREEGGRKYLRRAPFEDGEPLVIQQAPGLEEWMREQAGDDAV